MENELRYKVRCRECGSVEGRRYIERFGKRYYLADQEATPPEFIQSQIKSVRMLFPRFEKPICSECSPGQK